MNRPVGFAGSPRRVFGLTPPTALACLLLVTLGCAADKPPPAVPVQGGAEKPVEVVQRALDDAARRTGLPTSQLQVIATDEVTWTDGSLGCPAPGGNYTMAMVPGYRILIQAGGARLQYHASRQGNVLFCPPGRAQEPRRDERM